MELLNRTGSLLAEAGAGEEAARVEWLAAYRELLSRADAPRLADAAKLTGLLAALGLTLADAHADAAALAEVKRLSDLADAATDSGFAANFAAAGAALNAHREAAAKRQREDEEHNIRLLATIQTLSNHSDDVRRQRQRIEKLKAANPRFFPA